MRNIEWLRRKAERYDLIADYVNENTLKVYSPKFYFDNWLIKETEEGIELWHLNKKANIKKCTYHLQKIFDKRNKIRVLQKIESHNNYIAFYKNRNKVNLVDRLLGQVPAKISIGGC